MLNDWEATRNMLAASLIKEDDHAWRAGYEAAGLECYNMFKHIMHGPLREKWVVSMVDVLLTLCEVEDWQNPRDRGRLNGYIDIRDGQYASPNAS